MTQTSTTTTTPRMVRVSQPPFIPRSAEERGDGLTYPNREGLTRSWDQRVYAALMRLGVAGHPPGRWPVAVGWVYCEHGTIANATLRAVNCELYRTEDLLLAVARVVSAPSGWPGRYDGGRRPPVRPAAVVVELYQITPSADMGRPPLLVRRHSYPVVSPEEVNDRFAVAAVGYDLTARLAEIENARAWLESGVRLLEETGIPSGREDEVLATELFRAVPRDHLVDVPSDMINDTSRFVPDAVVPEGLRERVDIPPYVRLVRDTPLQTGQILGMDVVIPDGAGPVEVVVTVDGTLVPVIIPRPVVLTGERSGPQGQTRSTPDAAWIYLKLLKQNRRGEFLAVINRVPASARTEAWETFVAGCEERLRSNPTVARGTVIKVWAREFLGVLARSVGPTC